MNSGISMKAPQVTRLLQSVIGIYIVKNILLQET